MTIHCNAGTRKVHHVGDKNYGILWFDKGGIANILSLNKANNKLPVRHISATSNTYVITKPDREVYFHEGPTRLYFHDTKNRATALVTAKENMEGCTRRQVGCAETARAAQQMMRNPSTKD